MTAYYNENNPYAAQWLRNLIAAGHIESGEVDERSITEVTFSTPPKFAHFFAGIGGWDLALQIAGWPADWPVWTGSCPCQPFSAAGLRQGEKDERHLWPAFRALIDAHHPPIVFGEQVASKDGRLWLAGVRADLEAMGYEVGAADLCAAGVSAPHIRQRLYWVAVSESLKFNRGWNKGRGWSKLANGGSASRMQLFGADGGSIRVGDSTGIGDRPEPDAGIYSEVATEFGGSGPSIRMGNPGGQGLQGLQSQELQSPGRAGEGRATSQPGLAPIRGLEQPTGHGREQRRPESSEWGAVARCGADGKWRRIEPGIEPLAHGVPGRVGKLRAYGNAIVPQVAAQFIKAFMDSVGWRV